MNISSRGVRKTVGIPGTGLYFTESKSHGKSKNKKQPIANDNSRNKNRIGLGFWGAIFSSKEKRSFVSGLNHIFKGREEKGVLKLQEGLDHPDCAFVAGTIYLKKKDLENAAEAFEKAISNSNLLGEYFKSFGVNFSFSMPVTDEISSVIEPNIRGVSLALGEIYQDSGDIEKALSSVRRAYDHSPDDPVTKLSLVELTMISGSESQSACKEVARIADESDNQSPVHTELLYYKGRALRLLGLADASKGILTQALKRKKDRSKNLMHALRYERAQSFEAIGKPKKARADYERIFAENPEFEDVSARLGI